MNEPNSEETIFAEALRLPPAERSAYLAQSTNGSTALRQRVESLLKSYETGDFLEEAAASVLRQTVTLAIPLTEKPGDRIGRYKLLQQIGEGGCGVVYMAEQEEPVRRRVALKIIKLGMDTKNVIARFEAERQALAMMDHPNIAKVLDAGATETGRPYFVMELVRGMKITEYCDEAKLTTRARLDLFIKVCQAIQHAHQKGIIHRDIKPSNILVTVNDGAPVPKVIDFGIAKATTGQKLTDKTVFTAFEQFIGTPAYMSPEQAVITSVDIDTRSDIYALGVLLYELLTGKTPFDSKELLAIGLDEMRRTIRDTEPPKPSTRLSTMAGNELSTTAQHRGLDAPKLVSQLRGDLDWIVMKALEKDRARRYETANGLASDIQRHLSNEPVVACPPSNLYRFQKMVRRNKLAFASGAAVVAALVLGLGISTRMFLKEREALKRAVAAETTERRLRQEAELRELKLSALQAGNEADPETAEKLCRKTLETQRQLLGNEHLEVAHSLFNLAGFFSARNDFPEAEKRLREALAIFQKHPGTEDSSTAFALESLGKVLFEEEKKAEAEGAYRQAIEIRRRVQGEDNLEFARALNDLAVLLGRQNRLTEAAPLYRQSFAISRKLLGDGNREVAVIAGNLTAAMIDLGQFAEAEALIREVLPGNIKARPEMGTLLGRFIVRLLAEHKYDEGEALLNDLVSTAPRDAEQFILGRRAYYRACGGHFKEASADCARLMDLTSDDGAWHQQAALLAYLGQTEQYGEHCRRFLERFGSSNNPRSRERAVQGALLLPGSEANIKEGIRVADSVATTDLDAGLKYWFEFTKGLADYRRGRFADAIEHLENARTWGSEAQRKAPHNLFAKVYPVLAMAHFRLGNSGKASDALTKAAEFQKEGEELLHKGDFGESWDDWLRAFLLTAEAKTLMGVDDKVEVK